jgi:hypothetical protein
MVVRWSLFAALAVAATCLASGAEAGATEYHARPLFGGDMLMSKEQIREAFGPVVAAEAEQIFELRPPDAVELEHIQLRDAVLEGGDGRRLGAPFYESGRVWKYGRVFYHLDTDNISAEQVRAGMLVGLKERHETCTVSTMADGTRDMHDILLSIVVTR